jgi:uncharacterized protein YeaO (DUF488 family)
MSGVNPTYASLLRNGPKKQFDFAVKKYNQSPKNAYYYIKHMLDWLEWALKYYLECQEGRTLRQLQKLDQQRQVSLSKNGLTQRNEVAVVYRVVLFDEIGQQYREELGASPRETLSFLRERLVMAMKAVGESGSSRQPLNARSAAPSTESAAAGAARRSARERRIPRRTAKGERVGAHMGAHPLLKTFALSLNQSV